MQNKQRLWRPLNRIFKRLLAFMLTVGFSFRGCSNSQGKFRMDFARQNGFVNCWQPLRKFSQVRYGVAKFSQGVCGVVNIFASGFGVAKFSQVDFELRNFRMPCEILCFPSVLEFPGI